MDEAKQQRILNDPNFQSLCRRKMRFGVFLTIIVVVFSMGLLVAVPMAPEFLGKRLFELRILSIGVVWASALIVGAILVTGVYVWYANDRMSSLEEAVHKRLTDDP